MSEKREGPIYDLMRAYSQLTYGNMTPRVEAGYEARKWVHRYALQHSSFPHCEDRYGDSAILRGDVLEDTFKFSLGGDMKELLLNSYRERMAQMFAENVPPPNLEPIYVLIPIGGKIYVDQSTEEGRKAWAEAHPVERWVEKETGRCFLIRRTPEYIAEVETMAAQENLYLTYGDIVRPPTQEEMQRRIDAVNELRREKQDEPDRSTFQP